MSSQTSPSSEITQPETSPAQQVSSPPDVYAVFCGDINFINSQKLVNGFTAVAATGVKRVHLLFHSFGGFVGDGIFMYNFLRAMPIEVIMYNGGQVASAGVLAFLGAKQRKTAPNATFMIHRSHNSPQFANAAKLKAVADSLDLDDKRSESILKENVKLSQEEVLQQLEHHDVNLSSEESLKYGLVDEILNFSPPLGSKVLNALP